MMGKPLSDFVQDRDIYKISSFLSRKRSKLPPKYCNNVDYPSIGTRQFFHLRLKTDRDFNHFNIMGNYRRFGGSSDSDVSLSDYFFVGIVRPVKDRPVTELSLLESIQDQYITRHLPDGRIIYADHRISSACGYMPSDVIGQSGFYYILNEDLLWSAMANRQSMSCDLNTDYSFICIITQNYATKLQCLPVPVERAPAFTGCSAKMEVTLSFKPKDTLNTILTLKKSIHSCVLILLFRKLCTAYIPIYLYIYVYSTIHIDTYLKYEWMLCQCGTW